MKKRIACCLILAGLFGVCAANETAPIVNTGGPYILSAGRDLTLNGTMSDPGGNYETGALSARWFINNDQTPDLNIVSGQIAWATLNAFQLPRNQAFDIRLAVTNPNCESSESVTQLTIYDVYPVPYFSLTPSDGALCKQNIIFDARCSHDPDPGHSIVRYEWDFDASGSEFDFVVEAQGATVSHAYNMTGNFKPVLRITNNQGYASYLQKSITITAVTPPVADA